MCGCSLCGLVSDVVRRVSMGVSSWEGSIRSMRCEGRERRGEREESEARKSDDRILMEKE